MASTEMKGKNITTLDEKVEDWAWNFFQGNLLCPKAILKLLYNIEISWEGIRTVQDEAKVEFPKVTNGTSPNEEKSEDNTSLQHKATTSDNAASVPTPKTKSENDARKAHYSSENDTISKSVLENESDRDQQYTVRVEHTIDNTWSISLTEGVTHGRSTSFTLKLPREVLESGVTISRQEQVTTTEDHTIRSEVKWNGEVGITVPRKSTFEVIAKSTSRCLIGTFEVKLEYCGIVVIRLISKLSNTIYKVNHTDIRKILPDYKASFQGTCVLQYCADQSISIVQTKGEEQTKKAA